MCLRAHRVNLGADRINESGTLSTLEPVLSWHLLSPVEFSRYRECNIIIGPESSVPQEALSIHAYIQVCNYLALEYEH